MKKEAYIASKLREFPNVKHIDYSICSQCKSCCCKMSGCGLLPHDVPDMSVDGIKRMLDTGKYSITFMYISNMDKALPFMISRESGRGRINNSLIRSECALLGEKGCTLTEKERPTQALLAIPSKDRKCKTLVKPLESMKQWEKYEELMKTVIFEETGKSVKELFEEGCIQDAQKILHKIDNKEELNDAEYIAMDLLEKKFMHMIERNKPFNQVLLEMLF